MEVSKGLNVELRFLLELCGEQVLQPAKPT
jgi:hypothetical protein